MLKNKYKKILIISSCLVFVIMSVSCAVIMGNIMHKERCAISNCRICELIEISTDFIKNILLLNRKVLIGLVIVPLILAFKNLGIQVANKLNLVELNVIQLN